MGFKKNVAIAGVSGLAFGSAVGLGVYATSEDSPESIQAAECSDEWRQRTFSEICSQLVVNSVHFEETGQHRVDLETGELLSVNPRTVVIKRLDMLASAGQDERVNYAMLVGGLSGATTVVGLALVLEARERFEDGSLPTFNKQGDSHEA